MNKKGFINISLVVLAVLILGGAGYWYTTHYQKSGQPITKPIQAEPTATPSPIPTIDATAGWKIYANTKYGFEFKYPETVIFPKDFINVVAPFAIPDPFSKKSDPIIKKGEPILVTIDRYPETVLNQMKSSDPSFSDGYLIKTLGAHLVIQKSPNGSLEQYVKDLIDRRENNHPKNATIKIEKISPNGTEGVYNLTEYPANNNLDHVFEYYYFSDGQYLIVFSDYYQKITDKNYEPQGQDDNQRIDFEEANMIFHKILSTFKFTK